MHGPRIAAHQLRRRDVGLVGAAGMGLENHGPLSGHLTQVRIEFDVFHAPTSAVERLEPVDICRRIPLRIDRKSIIPPPSLPHFSKKTARAQKIVDFDETARDSRTYEICGGMRKGRVAAGFVRAAYCRRSLAERVWPEHLDPRFFRNRQGQAAPSIG